MQCGVAEDSQPGISEFGSEMVQIMDGSEPMQNDQTYFFSDIFLKIYNIIKIIIKTINIIKNYKTLYGFKFV